MGYKHATANYVYYAPTAKKIPENQQRERCIIYLNPQWLNFVCSSLLKIIILYKNNNLANICFEV